MIQFQTFDEILDFAIMQERAAQIFYAKLADEADDPERGRFYRDLVAQEQTHEEKLLTLKLISSQVHTPDLEELQKCGYLDALPLHPGMSFKEILRYVIKKEKSAKMLYTVLANSMQTAELADLFNTLAEQEAEHAEYFQKEYAARQSAD